MADTCPVCRHPDRRAIDQALAEQHVSIRTLAAQYDVSKSTLIRHRNSHLIALLRNTVVVEESKADARAAIDIGTRLRMADREMAAIFTEARQRGDDRIALQAMDRIIKLIDVQARLIVDTDPSADISAKLAALVAALAPFPDARQAAAAALMAGETQ